MIRVIGKVVLEVAHFINPDNILQIFSISIFSDLLLSSPISILRLHISKIGTHSNAEPRAILKKLFLSDLWNLPLPSAIFVEIDNAARLS